MTSPQASVSPRYVHLTLQPSSTMQVLSAPPTESITSTSAVGAVVGPVVGPVVASGTPDSSSSLSSPLLGVGAADGAAVAFAHAGSHATGHASIAGSAPVFLHRLSFLSGSEPTQAQFLFCFLWYQFSEFISPSAHVLAHASLALSAPPRRQRSSGSSPTQSQSYPPGAAVGAAVPPGAQAHSHAFSALTSFLSSARPHCSVFLATHAQSALSGRPSLIHSLSSSHVSTASDTGAYQRTLFTHTGALAIPPLRPRTMVLMKSLAIALGSIGSLAIACVRRKVNENLSAYMSLIVSLVAGLCNARACYLHAKRTALDGDARFERGLDRSIPERPRRGSAPAPRACPTK